MEKENSKFKKISYSIIGIIIMILFIFLGDKLNIIGNNTNTVPSDNDYVSEYYNIGMNEELLNILYFDVGQGDSTLITINGYTMLIDAGNPSDGYYKLTF